VRTVEKENVDANGQATRVDKRPTLAVDETLRESKPQKAMKVEMVSKHPSQAKGAVVSSAKDTSAGTKPKVKPKRSLIPVLR
jgi:hypothetical protein